MQMHANHREEMQTSFTPAISPPSWASRIPAPVIRCATKTSRWCWNPWIFPEPVIRVAIEPKTKAGQDKMTIALVKLAEEDPTFKAYTDQETGQTIIAGMGELHLEIIVDRMLREFKVEANVGKPPGGLPGGHHQEASRPRAGMCARPAAAASLATASSSWSPWSPASGY